MTGTSNLETTIITVMTPYQSGSIDQAAADALTIDLQNNVGGQVTVTVDTSLHANVIVNGVTYTGVVNADVIRCVRLPSTPPPLETPITDDHSIFSG